MFRNSVASDPGWTLQEGVREDKTSSVLNCSDQMAPAFRPKGMRVSLQSAAALFTGELCFSRSSKCPEPFRVACGLTEDVVWRRARRRENYSQHASRRC